MYIHIYTHTHNICIYTHKHKHVYINMQYTFLLGTKYRFLKCSNFQNSNAKLNFFRSKESFRLQNINYEEVTRCSQNVVCSSPFTVHIR